MLAMTSDLHVTAIERLLILLLILLRVAQTYVNVAFVVIKGS